MARGRKPIDRTALVVTDVATLKAPPGLPDVDRLEAALPEMNAFAAEEARRAQEARRVAVQVGYHGELTAQALIEGIHFYRRRTSEACLEMGNRLLMLQELTPPGEWLRVVEGLQMAERTAQRFMLAAWKVATSANLAALSRREETASKLLELLVLEDDEAGDLLAGKTVRGLTLDEIDRKSASELRAALRREKELRAADRESAAAKEQALQRVIGAKTQEIGRLQEREQLGRQDPDARLKALTGELSGMAAKLAFELRNNLGRAIQTVREVGEEHGIAVDDACAAALGMVRRALSDTEEDLGVSLSVRYPAWSYPDKEGRTPEAGPELGQVYGESDHERVEREFAETAAFAAAYDPKDTYRQTIAWMRAQGHSEEEIRATHAWHELYGAAAAPADAGSAVLDSAAAASLDSAAAASLDSAVAPSRLRVVGGGRLPAPELLPAPMLGQAGRQAGGE